jgi:uncharacterized glyoxalase superfamily metalloenzyme YdcJ
MTSRTELRAAFARSLSDMYGREVPAYTTLVQVATSVNTDVLETAGAAAERFGSIDRVTAERHGAIRLGTPAEMREVATLFAGFGMFPVGFYDLRDASASSVPVTSTAFRPTDRAELARNPFRVFTSVLMSADRRFFSAEVQGNLRRRFAKRRLFGPELLDLARRSAADDGLRGADAETFVRLATEVFALSSDPVDRDWYSTLEAISAVAADIGGVGSTHLNHLTPRVLDIDALYQRMTDRGIAMIDEIQGPPRWNGPDVLLRQTSFRALAEPRRFRAADGSVSTGDLRVRFGEVEARGVALTPAGRALYDAALVEIDQRVADGAGARSRIDVAVEVWAERFPRDEEGLDACGLGFFTYHARVNGPGSGADEAAGSPHSVDDLITAGWLVREPIVYEDFLPRSAAGIFQSNLSAAGSRDDTLAGDAADLDWMSGIVEAEVADPMALYAAEREESLRQATAKLGLPAPLAGATA